MWLHTDNPSWVYHAWCQIHAFSDMSVPGGSGQGDPILDQMDGQTPGTCWSSKYRGLDSTLWNGSPPGLKILEPVRHLERGNGVEVVKPAKETGDCSYIILLTALATHIGFGGLLTVQPPSCQALGLYSPFSFCFHATGQSIWKSSVFLGFSMPVGCKILCSSWCQVIDI